MCRLLVVRSKNLFPAAAYLDPFAEMCRQSREYQGHGFGVAYRAKGQWGIRKQLSPIWEGGFSDLGPCDFLVAHARSAFRNQGLVIENNMPFQKNGHLFVFNGELHGVRIKAPGRTGAEKIFNYILQFHRGDLGEAFRKALGIIRKRSEYVRAMNIMITDGERVYLSNQFEEDPDYFTLHHLPGEPEAYCSQPLGPGWQPLQNYTVQVV